MREQVHRVLFVSSLYESFILAEDGHLHERVLGEFMESPTRQPPDLIRVSSGRETLEILRQGRPRVDLVVTSPHVGDMDARTLARAIQEEWLGAPVVVLAYSDAELEAFRSMEGSDGLAGTFLWQGDARILVAIVKAVEDRLNAPADAPRGVPVFLVVEDSVRYYSSFLPVMYSELLNLSASVMAEAGNQLQQYLRLRARPKLLLSTTWEGAWRDFQAYQEHIMGVISDMEFPRDGVRTRDAGPQLVDAIRVVKPEVPIILQSSNPENEAVALRCGTGFLLKGAPDFLHQLRHTLTGHLFFGDFVFRDPSDGRELQRARDLKGFVRGLQTVSASSLAFHAGKHDISRWLRARGEFGLAAHLRPRQVEDYPDLEALRTDVVAAIDGYRRKRNRGTVIPFRRQSFDGEDGVVQLGTGSLGGKGRGLAFASRLLEEVGVRDTFPDVRIRMPPAVVLGTDVFDEFLDAADLRDVALQSDDEELTRRRMLGAPLPEHIREGLHRLLEVWDTPLAVRSSSLLEDSPYHSFAGIYGTWLLPNSHPDVEVRLAQLEEAVKRVYASTFSARARAFLQATPYRLEEEAMAVVVQRLVGRRHGDRFYPDIAGVARSHNVYPHPPAKVEDGVCAAALGLGRTVAEGDACVRFSPVYPEHIPEFGTTELMLDAAQRRFWALQLESSRALTGWRTGGPMARHDLETARRDGTLHAVGSVWSPNNDRVYDGVGRPGTPLVTFAPILKHGLFPLAEVIREILRAGMAGTRFPVEVEFAVDLEPDDGGPPVFGFLQLRPLGSREWDEVRVPDVPEERILCRSGSVLGQGHVRDIVDVVVVDPATFDRSRSQETARDVAWFNRKLVDEGRPYLLLGAGRWGSSQPWLGIPVGWEDISGARVIVEAGLRDVMVTPSQGTHFFQNLVTLQVGYFTVNAGAGEGRVDWPWLAGREATSARGCVRHLHLEEPLEIYMDGARREGVILKPAFGTGPPAM
jgi:hypothetical protein